MSAVRGHLAVESFSTVYATLGTLTLQSKIFPAVESAALLGDFVSTLYAATVTYRAWVAAVGKNAYTGAPPNTILVRIDTPAGGWTGTVTSIKVLVQGP
jgi:hypothetical protein